MVICRAIRKYGEDNFSFQILQSWDTQEDADASEAWWIKEFKTTDPNIGYNIRLGGDTTSYTEEFKQRLSEIMKEYYSDPAKRVGGPKLGHKFGPYDEERKEKTRQGLLKYYEEHPEAKTEITRRQTGKNRNPDNKRDPKTGRFLKNSSTVTSLIPDGEKFKRPARSEEHSRKLSESMKLAYSEGRHVRTKNVPRTPEVKKKLRNISLAWYVENEYTEERKEKISQAAIKQFSTPESREEHGKVTSEGMKKYFEDNPDKLVEHKERCRKAMEDLRDPVTGRIVKKKQNQIAA